MPAIPARSPGNRHDDDDVALVIQAGAQGYSLVTAHHFQGDAPTAVRHQYMQNQRSHNTDE